MLWLEIRPAHDVSKNIYTVMSSTKQRNEKNDLVEINIILKMFIRKIF